MKTREQAEAKAMELFPIEDFPFREDAERQEELRQAYLQCWEDMRVAMDAKQAADEVDKNKQTCGFCVEPKKKNEQCVLHSTDWYGKCFKCGEQVFVREPKKNEG